MKQRWKQFRYRLEWIGLNMLAWVIPRIPRKGIALLARGIGILGYAIDGRGRKVSLANIEAAFGDRFTLAQRKAIARSAYQDFVRTELDLLWTPALTQENFRRYIKFENLEILRGIRDRGESAIVICVHFDNFEWTSIAAGFEGFHGIIVAESFKNDHLSKVYRRCREVSGQKIIDQENSMMRMLRHIKKGGISGMLLDLNMKPSEASTVIDTFGMKLCASYLHAVLAVRGGAKLVPVEGRSQRDGTCIIAIHPPIKVPPDASFRQVAQLCWDFYEPKIEANPHHWMWAYKHWRYKPVHTDKTYPFYSYDLPAFEALLERIEREKKRAVTPGADAPGCNESDSRG